MSYPTEEEYRQAYQKWCQEHPEKTGADIPQNTVVEINGKSIRLGTRINHMKYYPERYSDNIEFWQSTGALEDKNERIERKYRQAALIWKKENKKNLSEMPTKASVYIKEFGTVNIGYHLSVMRRIYRMQKQGKSCEERKPLSAEQITWWTAEGMIWDNVWAHKKKTRPFRFRHQALCKELQALENENYELDNILEQFFMDYETFCLILEEKLSKKITNKNLENKTIKLFCKHSGYSETILTNVVKFKQLFPDESFEQILTRSIHESTIETEIPDWIMEKYTPYVIEILQYLNFPVREIIDLMKQDILSIEQAITIQMINEENSQKQDKKWLTMTTQYLVNLLLENQITVREEVISDFLIELKEHKLTNEDIKKLTDLSLRAFEKIRMFQMLEVGLETEEKKKIEKMREYHFSSEDIEESYFVTLRFYNAKKDKQEKDNYRLELLRQYIIDWRYYSQEEKRQIIQNHHFTEEEIDYMNTARQKIDHTIYKVKKIGKKS